MKDAFSAPQSLLVLGGVPDTVLATARRLIRHRTRTVRLAGPASAALDAAASELRGLGAEVSTVPFDALDTDIHEIALGKIFAEGDIDMALLAFGSGEGGEGEGDAGEGDAGEGGLREAVRGTRTAYTGAVSAALVCGEAMSRQGHGSLVVLAPAPTGRPRHRADIVRSAGAAGLNDVARGLRDVLRGTGVHVMVVRAGRRRGEPGAGGGGRWATTPEAVAAAVESGLRHRRTSVWAPGALRFVSAALRAAPAHRPRAARPRAYGA